MKTTLPAVFLFIMVITLQAQQLDHDTLQCSAVVRSHFSANITTGVIFHQMLNQDLIDLKVAHRADVDIFYKNYFFGYGVFSYLFHPKQEMTFGKYKLGTQAKILSINLNVALGYNYAFQKNWSAGVRLGINTTRFEIVNPEAINLYYTSKILVGAQAGIQLERYFKLKGFNYIVLRAEGDYFSTDYSKASIDLKSSALNYSLAIGYKMYFKKIVN